MTKKIKEISTGDYYSKAHKGKISAASKMMFADPAKPEVQKAMRDFKNRDAGMKRVSARNQKARQTTADKNRQGALAADKENLPALMAQFQKLRGQYDPNFEYSDDHSFWSKQKDIQQQLSALQKRINDAGGKVSEGTNPEYDDEAGMSDNNLETLRRTIDGIDGLIKPGDNLPEWCQEKIAVAKSMLVAVWDYMQSEQERGASVAEGGVKEWKKGVKAPVKPRNFVAKNASTGGAGAHKDKKKDAKQGKAKHKKTPELAETATYDRRLNVLLEAKMLTSQIRDYRKK
jgi:flagellar biosynthesis chaperone FliJ